MIIKLTSYSKDLMIFPSLEENLLHWMGNVNMTAEVLLGYKEQDLCPPVLSLFIK